MARGPAHEPDDPHRLSTSLRRRAFLFAWTGIPAGSSGLLAKRRVWHVIHSDLCRLICAKSGTGCTQGERERERFRGGLKDSAGSILVTVGPLAETGNPFLSQRIALLFRVFHIKAGFSNFENNKNLNENFCIEGRPGRLATM